MTAQHFLLAFTLLASTTASADEATTTITATSPAMAVVVDEPAFALRLGVDVTGGVFFPGPAPGAGLAARIGVQRKRLGLLVELGILAGSGGIAGGGDDHTASGAIFALASATPGLQYDLGAGAFIGAGVVLGAGLWAHTTDVVDDDTVTQQVSKSATFIPGLDARVGWRFGEQHQLTLTVGAKALASAVRTDTVVVSTSAAPTASVVEGIGWAVLPTLSIGYDFN